MKQDHFQPACPPASGGPILRVCFLGVQWHRISVIYKDYKREVMFSRDEEWKWSTFAWKQRALRQHTSPLPPAAPSSVPASPRKEQLRKGKGSLKPCWALLEQPRRPSSALRSRALGMPQAEPHSGRLEGIKAPSSSIRPQQQRRMPLSSDTVHTALLWLQSFSVPLLSSMRTHNNWIHYF